MLGKHRRWEKPSKVVTDTLREMRDGAILHREHRPGGDRWWLEGENGRKKIHQLSAAKLIKAASVVPREDGLFPGSSQSFVHVWSLLRVIK